MRLFAIAIFASLHYFLARHDNEGGFKIPKGNQHINNFVLINAKENIRFNGYWMILGVSRKMNQVRVKVLFGEYISPVKPQSHLFSGGRGCIIRTQGSYMYIHYTDFICVRKLHHYS